MSRARGLTRAADALAEAGQCAVAAVLLRDAERSYARTRETMRAAQVDGCLRSMSQLTRDMIEGAKRAVAACRAERETT